MARFLANFASCPLLGPGRHFQSKTCSSQAPALRIQSFSSGLRASSALDLTARPGQDLFFKVNLSISSRRGKASRCVTKATFEGLTEKAVKVIRLSQAEARKLGHDSVGTEHILVGLIREETGIAAKVLTSMGITLEDTREEVEKIIGRGSGSIMPGEIPFTPRAKCVLDLSLEEARKLGHYEVGPEHLLLALLRKEGEGVASRVLENLGAYHSDIWKQVIRMICKNNEEKSRYVYKGVDEDIKMPRPDENEDDDLTKVKNRDEEEDVPGKSVMIFNFFF